VDLGLKDRVVLVTGAGQGLGEALGLAFAREGARVAFHYLSSAEGAQRSAAVARGLGVKAQAYRADVRDRSAVDRLVASIEQDLGPLDVLVSNHAYTARQEFLESTPEDWRPQLEVTVTGMMHICQAALRRMVIRQSGSIVIVTGDSGRVGESKLAVTAAARAGAIGFGKSLAKEMARFGIRVNMVSLGLLETPSLDRHLGRDPALLERVLRQYPLGRLGGVDDVVPMVLLLASDRASWVTGQVVSINGGYSMV
jgi:3-oxoacyl-[acyl-carrier protein] reductase